MNTAKHLAKNNTNHFQLWSFLFLCTTAFFPLVVRAQQPFNCQFSNPDGGLVYPCASIVTATINMPPSNNPIQQIQLIFPNSFEITSVDGSPFPTSTVAIPGGIYNGTYSNTDLLGQWIPVPLNATQMIVTLAYISCDIYPLNNASIINTNHLYFDCKGFSGSPNNITYNASLIPGNPGLPVAGGAAIANYGVTNAPPAIEIIGTPPGLPYSLSNNNNLYTTFSGDIFIRYFDVIINAASIDQFNLNLTNEDDVEEIELLYVSNNNLAMLSTPLINSTDNTTEVGYGNYAFTFGNNPALLENVVPSLYFTTNTDGSRKITFAQRVRKICSDNTHAFVSTSFDCGAQCPDQLAPIPPLAPFQLRAEMETLVTTFTAPNISLTSEPGAGNSICGPSFAYTFDFTYNNDIISQLNNFILPLNTQSFEVQSIEIGVGNNFTTISVPDPNIQLNQPSATSSLNINVNAIFGTSGAPANPCFTNPLPGSTFNNGNGAWINADPAVTHLVIKINLQLISLTSSSCSDAAINLGRLAPFNTCTLQLRNTCGGNAPPVVFPVNVTTPTINGASIGSNFPPSYDLANGPTVPINYVIQIPAQSPFEINVDNVTQISCSTTEYQAILSMANGATFGNNAIPTATVTANGTNYTITPIPIGGGAYMFNLPTVNANQGFYTYNLSFQLGALSCPPCGTCTSATFGAYVYNLEVAAVCQNCNPEIRRNIICKQNPMEVHCPGTCSSPVDFEHNSAVPDIERITFGWVDETDFLNNQNAPLTLNDFNLLAAGVNLPALEKDKQLYSVYPYDLFTYKAAGSVQPETTQNFHYTSIGLELRYPQGNLGSDFLQLIDYTATFTNGGNTPIIIGPNDIALDLVAWSAQSIPAQNNPNLPITIPVDSYTREIRWPVGDAFNPGLFQEGIDINNITYTIAVTCTFRVVAITPAGFEELPIYGQFVGESNDGTGNTHHLTSCDPWYTDLKVIIPSVQVIQNSEYSGNIELPNNVQPPVGLVNAPNPSVCKFGHAIGIRHSGGNGVLPDFFPEYRPLTSWPQQINASSIESGTGFFPGAYTYNINGLNYLELNGTDPLLPPLQRQLSPNNLQGIVLTLKEDCPNPGVPASQNLPADLIINQYAYINDQHLINTPPLPPNQPTNPTIAPADNPPAGNTNCNFLTLPGGPGIINLSNALPSHIYDFSLQIPANAINLPFAIRITPPINPNVSIPVNNTNIIIPGSTQIGNSNWFVFNSGLPNTNVVQCSMGIQIVGNNGCYALPFDVDFEVQVYCDVNQLPTALNQNPVACLACSNTRAFQRGAMDLSNVNITTSFSPSGCDFVFELNLTNPANQPTIHAAGLILQFSTGMILQQPVGINFSGLGVVNSSFNFPYYLNQNLNGLSTGGIYHITANSVTLFPGETLTYTLTFQLAEAWCNGLYDASTALFGVSLLALNGCEPSVIIPVVIDQTDLSAYISSITQDPTCCVPNPIVNVTHVCDPNATNGVIEVNYPNFGPGVYATIYRPELCSQLPCSWTTAFTSNVLTISAANAPFGFGIGTYRLVVWDASTGAFFEQFVVIEDHSVTATISSNATGVFCGGTNITLTANPNPAVSVTATSYTYAWSNGDTQNPITVAPASTTTYSVTITNGDCSVTTDHLITVLATPGAPPITGITTICQTTPPTQSTNLDVLPAVPGEDYNWFADPTLTNLIGVGTSFTTPTNLTTNTTYYVQAVNIGTNCSGPVTIVTVNVVQPIISASGPTIFCNGNSVTLNGNIIPGVWYNWWKDNVSIPGADFVAYTATASGFYQLFVTDQVSGCTVLSAGIMVEVDPPVIISGSNTACNSGLNQYSLPSYFPASTQVNGWYLNGQPIPEAGNPSNYNSEGMSSVIIDWAQNNYFGGTINVETNIICGSSGNVTYSITPCCSQIADVTENNLTDLPQSATPIPWHNGTISYDNTLLTYTIEGATFELNNTGNIGTLAQSLNCNSNLTLIDCNIAMASGNQFLINTNQDVVVSNSYIKACEYRHRGIRAENGGNYISIAGGQIEDADYGVRITNGKLNCKIAGFNKNLYHIFAIQSDVKINGGYYTCTGNIVPVNNFSSTTETTYWAIDLFKCMTPTNTLPSIYNILIDNAEHGIRSIYGGIDCKGNTINNTVQGIIVSHGYPYSNSTAQNCFIGDGGGTNIPNEFNNSYSAINVFGKLSKLTIKDNRINNCKTYGMHLAKLEGNGFTVKNNVLNNCRIGIHGYLNLTNGTFLGSSTVKEIVGNEIYNHPTNPILHGNYLIQSKGIFIEEQFAVAKYPNIHIDIIGNEVRDYRHGISLINCVYPLIQDNAVYVNSKLDGIWDSNGSLTNFINGIGIFNCPGATILENKVSSTATTPYAANWLTSGFRVDMSPKSTICGNLASETGNYPGTSLPMQIGDPFEFHGNCIATRFRLNTMDQSTSRGLYMGGMPIQPGNNPATNGTIIGVQGDQNDIAADNTWGDMNLINGGLYADFNNVDGAYNKFYMSYAPVSWPVGSTYGMPVNTTSYNFQSDYSGGVIYPCTSANPSPIVQQRMIDDYDDIAKDSISKLGGNDTTRYFGKEFLYSQLISDSSLAAYSVLTQFKDSMDLSNAKHIEDIKQGLVLNIDSSAVDSLNSILSLITPVNNIEDNFKNVAELSLKNPSLRDSIFNLADYVRLKTIAKMCPYVEGTAVYTARVILHAFEPDSNYYNYCEFAKRPDRTSNERNSNVQPNASIEKSLELNLAYKVIPNPNNGTFELLTSSNNSITCEISDMAGRIIERGNFKPTNYKIAFNFNGQTRGVYNLKVIDNTKVTTIKIVIN